jgi:HK97 family phage major capsid protein
MRKKIMDESLQNKSDDQIEQEIEAMTLKRQKLIRTVGNQGRPLNSTEQSIVDDMADLIQEYKNELKLRQPVGGPLTLGRFSRSPGGKAYGQWNSAGEFFSAVYQAGLPSGRMDRRLYGATGLGETVPSEGGFLVAPELSREILQDSIAVGKLASRCRRQPIGANANGIKINGVDETSRATGSRFGGLRAYWLDEAGEKTASKPKFRQIELALKKLVVLVYATDELLQDAVALESFLRQACPAEIAFSTDDAILNGTGAGQPLGILSAGCLVQVAKETGQREDTIVAENIVRMYARNLNPESAVWLINKSTLPQLFTMSLSVGTGGAPIFMPAGGLAGQPYNTLLGRPVIMCEQSATLGDLGDIVFADMSGYIFSDKGGVQTDVSIHVRFVYDESVFRFVYRVDGQPVRASALTPYKGGASNTESSFVALAERT